MAVIVIDCPHCGAKHTSFEVVGSYVIPREGRDCRRAYIALCGRCHLPVSGVAYSGSEYLDESARGELARLGWRAPNPLPKPEPVNVPELLDADVASLFQQARTLFKQPVYVNNNPVFDAACAMYRKTMECALKNIDAGEPAWKLEKEIDKLAKDGVITTAMRDWAHELRLDGNDTTHGNVQATKGIAEDMDSFCYYLLMYLFTLPRQVEKARARRANGT